MNTPKSREGNLIRYAVYVIGYLIMIGVVELVTRKTPLRIWDLILFILIAVMILLFYIYRFNREQRFFESQLSLPILSDLGLTISLTILITALRIGVMYLQSYNCISWYNFQTNYLKHESTSLFWFLILAQGIILPIMQEFLASGFLFNYAFRRNSKWIGFLGLFSSGLIYSLLNFQLSIPLFVINLLFGSLFAWSYLYTQTLWMPIYLATISGVLTVIMT